MKKLAASDAANNSNFGVSVAIDGDTIVAGANAKNAAYVFARNQGGADNWGQVKKLTASDGTGSDAFGGSVAIDGDSVVVGAWGKSSNQGATYVFGRNHGGADNWGQIKKLTASDGAANDVFGESVAIDGDTIVVAAKGKSSNQGAGYVFARNQGGADNWGQIKKLTASDAAANDYFGNSIAIKGDAVAVGAASKASGQGAAYVFARNQGGGAESWGQALKLTASDGAEAAYFGSSVAIDWDTIVVGALGKYDFRGGAYVFLPTASTTTTLAASPNPSVYGQTVSFTASVTSTLGTPTGTVTFTVDSAAAAAVALSSGTATYSTSSLAVGSHSVSAYYGGDTSFNPGTSLTITQVVTRADTTSALAAAPNPSVYGQTVTFTATVTSTGGTPGGIVTFTVDSSAVATATLSGGSATYSTSALAVGSHVVGVAYGGDGNFNGSSASLTGGQTVNKADTTSALAASPNPSVYGQTVSFTATVTSTLGTPTGTVTFTVDGAAAAAVALSSGTATYSTSSLAVGSHSVSAYYGGDTSFNPGTSLTITQVVTRADTTTTITAVSPNPVVVGESAVVTFTVSAVSPGAGTPTGSVTVSGGGSSCGATLPATSCAMTFISSGTYAITATYAGDANFNGGSSVGTSETVLPAVYRVYLPIVLRQ